MGEEQEMERREKLASQVARLEERSVHGQAQLERIERLLNQQTVSMEKMMGEFTQKMDELEDSIESKIDPLQKQITFWKGSFAVLSVIVVAILIPLALMYLGA